MQAISDIIKGIIPDERFLKMNSYSGGNAAAHIIGLENPVKKK